MGIIFPYSLLTGSKFRVGGLVMDLRVLPFEVWSSELGVLGLGFAGFRRFGFRSALEIFAFMHAV